MNDVFRVHLVKFLLIFYDTMIYSPSFDSQLLHLRASFTLHREHCPFVKKQKCIFAQSEVEHLGLVVSSKGVAFAHSKIQVMEEWPIRQSIKALFGFLGHTGYYRKFVTSSGKISAFKWNEEAMKAFMSLKHAITTTPALPCLVLTSCL